MLRRRITPIFQDPAQVNNITSNIVDGITYVNMTTFYTQLAFYFKERQPSICDEEDNGMFGVVSRGYFQNNTDGVVPNLAIKRFRTLCQNGEKDHVLNGMKKEVYCQRKLGRKSYYFLIKNVGYVIYPWQVGIRLTDFFACKQYISSLDILYGISSFLQQLQLLHKSYIAHGDLGSDNVIINPETYQISLVDLGSAKLQCHQDPEKLQQDVLGVANHLECLIQKLNSDADKPLLMDLQHRLSVVSVAEAAAMSNTLVNDIIHGRSSVTTVIKHIQRLSSL